jgi:uncharacterized membrane protein HdeD (DUF308 family)
MATRRERKLAGSGGRFVAVGAPLIVIGIVLALLVNVGIGAAIAILGALPVLVGVALILSAGVEQHSRKRRPLA